MHLKSEGFRAGIVETKDFKEPAIAWAFLVRGHNTITGLIAQTDAT
jgi:hypothetical protein